jgi:hypothetical protein
MTQIGFIYKLCCIDPEIKEIYVGSTINLRVRKYRHKCDCTNENSKNYNCNVYQFIRAKGGFSNWSIIQLERFEFNTRHELHARERHYVELLKASLNTVIPSRTLHEYYVDNKEKILEQSKKYKEEHKEKYKEYDIKYREKNEEKIRENKKLFYQENKEKLKEQKMKYREENKEAIKERSKKYREEHKENQNKYYEENKEKIKEQRKKKYQENKIKNNQNNSS